MGTQEMEVMQNTNGNCYIARNLDLEYIDLSKDFYRKKCRPFPPALLPAKLHNDFDFCISGTCLLHVYLDHSNLTQLPTGLGRALPLVEIFSVNGNGLMSLPDDFGHISSLKALFVGYNFISSLPESLHKLRKLRVLDATSNKLETLYSEIGQNVNLRILKVKQNRLKSFPSTLGLLKKLEVLDAEVNLIEFLPSTVNFMQSLNIINLKNNCLSSIPETLGDLQHLKSIDLSKNNLEKLFDRCQSTLSLETLVLDSNMLKKLPLWIGDLLNVQEISVTNNKLCSEFLPDELDILSTKLTSIDLSGNQISRIPNSICKIVSLKRLSMGNSLDVTVLGPCRNWLHILPENLVNLRHLTVLQLEGNQLRALPEDFGKLLNLEEIYLGSNMINSIPESFSYLASIRICRLSENFLSILPDNFGALITLTELYLDSNKLRKLPDSMKNLTNLKVLNLKGNPFKVNPNSMFTELTNLKDYYSDFTDECHDESFQCKDEDNREIEDNDQFEKDLSRSESWDGSNSTDSMQKSVLTELGGEEENWDEVSEKEMSGNNGQFDLDETDSVQPHRHEFSYIFGTNWIPGPAVSYTNYYARCKINMFRGCVTGQFDHAES
uniref:Uncharacterized protein n=1 Tax=Biomphalaria glabrata TaxID=6526 RepID=A0A2C9KJE6_BIOGL